MSELYFPPLDKGASVASDVVTSADERVPDILTRTGIDYDGPCDLVLVAVPAGEGVAVEATIRRALRVEGS